MPKMQERPPSIRDLWDAFAASQPIAPVNKVPGSAVTNLDAQRRFDDTNRQQMSHAIAWDEAKKEINGRLTAELALFDKFVTALRQEITGKYDHEFRAAATKNGWRKAE